MSRSEIEVILADENDIERMQQLIRRSARGLGMGFYSESQIESAIKYVYGVDSTLIADKSYFQVVVGSRLAGCGGWSQRDSLYGGRPAPGRQHEAVAPWHRRGADSRILH